MNFFGKSYNEIEAELNETKSKIQLLEEKIEYLIQKDIDMTKVLCESNSKIQLLEEKLQKNKSSLISITQNSLEIGPRLVSKTNFIDINCSNITILVKRLGCEVNYSILIDDVSINSDCDISKLISELKNIKNINYSCYCHEVTSYTPADDIKYKFDIIKQILKINNKVKLMMSFPYDFPYNWIKCILTDLHFDNILEIEITYNSYINRDNTDILTLLDNNKTIMFKNTHKKSV